MINKYLFFIPFAVKEIDSLFAQSLYIKLRTGAFSNSQSLDPSHIINEKKSSKILFWLRRVFNWICIGHIVFILTTSLLIMIFSRMDPPATVLYGWRKVVNGWETNEPKTVKLADTKTILWRMLISVEDGKFWTHWGIDLNAFRNAIKINKRVGWPMYGGSTLTMQTARTLFLIPVKSYLRKYLEVIIALEMELFLSKQRILELYLSWAEWGKGVFGVDGAAREYYGVSAQKLGIDQSARIIAILSSPIKYSPVNLSNSSLLKTRYNYLIRKYL